MFGEYAEFVIPSYLATALVFLAIVVVIRVQYASRKRDLKALEEQGIKRRSARNAKSGGSPASA